MPFFISYPSQGLVGTRLVETPQLSVKSRNRRRECSLTIDRTLTGVCRRYCRARKSYPVEDIHCVKIRDVPCRFTGHLPSKELKTGKSIRAGNGPPVALEVALGIAKQDLPGRAGRPSVPGFSDIAETVNNWEEAMQMNGMIKQRLSDRRTELAQPPW